MANHGYINRDGKNLSAWSIAKGLRECYGLTMPFSIFLSYTTFLLLRKFRPIDLYEIGKHGVVEHNASLVHHDTPPGQIYAPIEIDQGLVEAVVKDAQTVVEAEVEVDGVKQKKTETLYSIFDMGRSRVRREKESPPLTSVQAKIARGELAIIQAVWEKKVGEKVGSPIEWIKRWLGEERLPDGWKPDREVGFVATNTRNKAIQKAMEEIRKQEAEAADPKAKL
ncbi:hypothetical protein CC1G_06710 [Coprinopsis cinerea okayama7|uniref:Heme haloperoxidase family profile domain-containing protein n=1 Tax=Coprinopsis cinerea (strain Okayama-7 / 130 / ATCC MYA-4618 / FGSC 9003) TaxID=240176 RepID=A8P840_COPC7|nr:hypothetical protein CC1G_06710 [Coprinopsis cinerea okayama7\|eukprot:XP_001839497.2 hypothetical protein CC1G_06710 [Coprinopsis cinerea okayama7\